MTPFRINFLDHVAIKVADVDTSVNWYKKVLGLEKVAFPEWGVYPVLMLAGRTGVAIFPAKVSTEGSIQNAEIRIDHFAFNVTQLHFEAAKRHYDEIKQAYHFRDHVYFHSIYTKDPDGHIVELTTLVGDENEVYT